ncbi:MAG: glutamate formimidoyltransferase [Candidatus Scalindua sp. AMX11]|nr:MAG: glutamate formimidoyltransferase [Candidatus Scalindua sp.]NOG84522.1 glutamate formimidoyltransferase [Planctomycetota bacterium]RZV80471.1 MAG: glutamate formimidoyltransferase [Candidatus Scalindua sp. SCAELEC01]TDE65318.1 MAG: glutamate formimidoyltransferase [Candidatus Scalindua sp. AMX11]
MAEKKIVECVPNFSEGRNIETIDAIEASIVSTENIKLLNRESDRDYNRTVITFAGEPSGVKTAAFRAIAKASELIDMSQQCGEHPRIGATDVCPLIPVSNVTMNECVQLAHELGRDVGERLGIPVYLYESAARLAERRNLESIRKGEYEGLRKRIKEWRPDYGPTEYDDRVRKSGATVIGARFFLIAYNINLKTQDVRIAHNIARMVRESGSLVKDVTGKERRVPGILKYVKAIGVELKEYNITQVSINLTNYEETSLHKTFETVKKLSREFGTETTGSEIIGLVPKKALIDAGSFYTETQSEGKLIEAAVENLGLSQLNRFESRKKIIEYLL